MRPFFASILTICFIPAYTQDYVVTTRKDTLRGKVAISSYTNMDRVQLNAEKKKTEFAATAVSTVSLDSQIYQPVRITDGFRLLKLERSGHVSLYLGRQSPGTPYNVPFLVKKSGESMEVSSLRFKKYMITFLEDCSSIEQKIEAGNLGRKDLDKIIDEYNRCIEKQTDKSLIPGSDPRLLAVTDFQNKLQGDSTVPADALDIVKDLYSKVKENKAIPNYLTEGLRELLQNHPAYQTDLDSLLKKIKG